MSFDSATSDVGSALQAAGFSQRDVDRAMADVDAKTGLPLDKGVGAVKSLLSGQDAITSAMPLIGMAMASAGVAAPIVAAVTVGFPLVKSFIQDIFGQGTPGPCTGWTVGEGLAKKGGVFGVGGINASPLCFPGPRPDGPTSRYWVKVGAFVQGMRDAARKDPGIYNGWGGWQVSITGSQLVAYHWVAECQMGKWRAQYNASGKKDLVAGFHYAYCSAWVANAERLINGHPYVADSELLSAVLTAWNETHGSGSTISIQPDYWAPTPNPDVVGGWFSPYGSGGHDSSGKPYLDPCPTHDFIPCLLSGNLQKITGDGTELGPITINTSQPDPFGGNAAFGGGGFDVLRMQDSFGKVLGASGGIGGISEYNFLTGKRLAPATSSRTLLALVLLVLAGGGAAYALTRHADQGKS